MGKIIDITGETFGYLTVLEPTRVNNRFGWKCKCVCGKIIEVDSNNLRTGKTQSCGCMRASLVSKKNTKDKVGQKFGFLTVLEPTNKRSGGSIVWKCQCECGNICYIPTSNLSRNHTTSCGCKKYVITGEKARLKLTGKVFGKLTVLEELPVKKNESRWKCKCECGNEIEASGWLLTKGAISSCGCVRSKGEAKIKQLLLENNIPFQEQKTFDTCLSPKGAHLKFDFYVNNQYLIEYDGEQHFLTHPQGYYTQEVIEDIKQRDQIKNKWCEDNNIPLIRLNFTQYDGLTLNDLLLKEN